MNNKPVAWMLKTGHGTKILEVKPYCEVDYWIPLYTHPANACKHGVDDGACKECYLESSNPYKAITNTKIEPTAVSYTHPAELTDEEIIELTPWKKYPYESFVEYQIDDIVDFARAILRKAQDK